MMTIPARGEDEFASGRVVWGGRCGDESPDALDDWNASAAAIHELLADACELVVLDALSFPWQALSTAERAVPLITVVPAGLSFDALNRALGDALFDWLTPVDRLVCSEPETRRAIQETWRLDSSVWLLPVDPEPETDESGYPQAVPSLDASSHDGRPSGHRDHEPRSNDDASSHRKPHATQAGAPSARDLALLGEHLTTYEPSDRLLRAKLGYFQVTTALADQVKVVSSETAIPPRCATIDGANTHSRHISRAAGMLVESINDPHSVSSPDIVVLAFPDGSEDAERQMTLRRSRELLHPGGRLIISFYAVSAPDTENPSTSQVLDELSETFGSMLTVNDIRSLRLAGDNLNRIAVLTITSLWPRAL